MNQMRALALLFAAALASGCETTTVRHAAVEVERAAVVANDLQLEVAEKGLCASSLSAVGRKYGGKPEMLRALLVLCDWGSHDITVLTSSGK